MHYPTFKKLVKLLALVSGTFLILIGILNLMILISLITLFLKFRKDKINDEKLNDLLDTRLLFLVWSDHTLNSLVIVGMSCH